MRRIAQQCYQDLTQRSCLAPWVPGDVEKEGAKEGGWEQVRGFFSEPGVLERQGDDSSSRSSLSFMCSFILSAWR